MVRGKNDSGCMCRVRVAEAAIPMFTKTSELYDWASKRGIEIAPDYAGHLSVTVAVAYELRDEADRQMAEHEAAQQRETQRLDAAARVAQEKRQATFDQVVAKMGAAHHPRDVMDSAWEAVHDSEKTLDPQVRMRLGGVRYDYDAASRRHLRHLVNTMPSGA